MVDKKYTDNIFGLDAAEEAVIETRVTEEELAQEAEKLRKDPNWKARVAKIYDELQNLGRKRG